MKKRKCTSLPSIFSNWIAPFLLVIIIMGSIYFRVSGLFWGDYQFLHPDERFLIWVTNDISPVDKIGDYFNTAISSLNPQNRGHSFYVYGDFPVILTRYITGFLFDNISWNQITQVGRSLSALFDFGSVFLIFLIGKKLFKTKVGLLASAFSSVAVLQIQQAHFYTVDTFATFFTTLAVYLAVLIIKTRFDETPEIVGNDDNSKSIPYSIGNHQFRSASIRLLLLSALFGIVVGLAASSKINTVFVAILLPLAYTVLWDRYPNEDPIHKSELVLRDLMIGAVFALITFRIFQPYAFSGPSFFDIQINPKWLGNLKELANLSNGDVDYPPALQWARRNITFAPKNITLWGLGIPLSIPFWIGLICMGWRMLKGEWRKFAVIWVWAVGYFIWQASLSNPMMRYQLPVYPIFSLIAAWFIFWLIGNENRKKTLQKVIRGGGYLLGIIALVGSVIWAYMFTRIYVEPMSRVAASQWIYDTIPGPINLMLERNSQLTQEVLSLPYDYPIDADSPYSSIFVLSDQGRLKDILLAKVIQSDITNTDLGEIDISIFDIKSGGNLLATGSLQATFSQPGSGKGVSYTIPLDQPVELLPEHTYQLLIEYMGEGAVVISGSAVAVETTWDDPLPVRLDGRDPYGGIYQNGLNFEMYFPDDQAKLDRFYSILNQTDYIFMSSNRQWGTTTRVPERYPLTTEFYRQLLGCPLDQDPYWCYSVAEPGMFTGNLGFELVKTFDSYPKLGNWQINDQFAEESFTVYDHPKVLIFKKTDQYNPATILAILGKVDLTKVRNLTPAKFPNYPADLELPDSVFQTDQINGTWSMLFDRISLVNSSPIVTVLLWYFVITLFGWLIFPIVRIMLSGLKDRGYTYSKLVAMLLLALSVWLGGSSGLAVTRYFIFQCLITLAFIGIIFGIIQRKELLAEFRLMKYYYLWVEILSILLFSFFLLIRLGNPDLWHPAKGGEKPMDFAYLNAVIKSNTFPPYDPWYAGGYLNYYYYGFVIVGIWVKLLGIIPSIAYNLILPLLYSIMGIGAFGFLWNLTASRFALEMPRSFRKVSSTLPFFGGLLGIIFTIFIGNLGTIRMIWQGFQKLGSPTGVIDVANFFNRILWSIKGLVEFITGANLPYTSGDWYWIPSRALPQSPITEFPFFTFLYGDLHAHLMALPITILALSWCLSVLTSHWKFSGTFSSWIQKAMSILLGAVVIGALRPTNTWDFPTYLILALLVLLYTIISNGVKSSADESQRWNKWHLPEAILIAAALLFLALLLYKPFSDWYGQAYSAIDLWKGDRSPFWSYFTHWGFFLVVITSWFAAETIQWMETTPYSSLLKLRKYKFPIAFLGIVFLFILFLLILLKVSIGWAALSLAVWAFLLILRSKQNDLEKLILFMTGTALVLTIFVEVFVLRGDIARMNTVFKFYLQAWVLLALSAGYGAVWLIDYLRLKRENHWVAIWKYAIILLFTCTVMYPLLAGVAKIEDRISNQVPLTLDGMAYMKVAYYQDAGNELQLSQDYEAIRWMQENITGSPVIVEGNTVEYRWGSRFSIYTGLPGVIGWNWHERQQRAVLPSEWITNRVDEVAQFYLTFDQQKAKDFLEKYNVKYIIVGQLERALYPGGGLDKFDRLNQKLWKEIYHVQDTVIYEVIP